MMQKTLSIFMGSAGTLLLALASALFLVNCTSPANLVPPHDPILFISVRVWFWLIAGLAFALAMVCCFGGRQTLQIFFLIWFATSFWAWRIALFNNGCHSLTGYLSAISYDFGISAKTASAVVNALFAYLIVGSCVALWFYRRLPAPVEFQKMACPACGGRLKFPVKDLGQKIECPRCNVTITLRKLEETLKMNCFFCMEHIEFPAHALGRKINCPHCKMEIGLKETL